MRPGSVIVDMAAAQGGNVEGALAGGIVLLVVALLVGAAIGLWRARVVEMTGMPELTGLMHSVVGLAALLVEWLRCWRCCWASTWWRPSRRRGHAGGRVDAR